MPQIRRQQLLVNRKLQGRLMLRAVAYWFYCLLSISLFAACWIVWVQRPTTSAELFDKLWFSCGPALMGSALLLPLVLLDCLRFSNRFTGPMVRVQNTLQQLVAGQQVRPIQLRKHDYWQELAQCINQVMQRGIEPQVGQDGASNQPDPGDAASNADREPDMQRA